jgi:predicted transcriptional regulator
MKMPDTFDVCIDPKIMRRVEYIASEENMSFNDVINRALSHYVRAYQEVKTTIGKNHGATLSIVDRNGVVYTSFEV